MIAKTFQTYLYFALTLIRIQPELANILAYGTDGEQALISTISHEFWNAVHIHL